MLAQLATNQLVTGNVETARQLLAQATATADVRAYWDRLDLELAAGRLALALAQPSEAARHFTVARRLAHAKHSRYRLAEVRLEHARAQLALGRRQQASEALVDAELAFEHMEALALLAQTHCAWAHLLQSANRPAAARAALHQAEELAQRLGSHGGRSLQAELQRARHALAP
jgi:hypothetical protein